jgi:DNA-binding transcriptional LysR family regulator
MKLSHINLVAFYELAKSRSFSRAAENLHITQSALSQRIAKLEADLEASLFIRESSGITLTDHAQALLRYCQMAQSLEEETLGNLNLNQSEISGTIRIAGFSSIMRSVIIPALAPFLRANPKINCEFSSYEVFELYDVLRSSKADVIILDYHLDKSGIVEHTLGKEEYVVIESSKHKGPSDLYLDHGPNDNATESFFRFQKVNNKPYRRGFMGDVYGIIDGVEQGLGRAVMSEHLIRQNKKVRIVNGYKKYFRDITLNYYEQPFYSKLHQAVCQEIINEASNYF